MVASPPTQAWNTRSVHLRFVAQQVALGVRRAGCLVGVARREQPAHSCRSECADSYTFRVTGL
jgi:hypothetical protein